MLRLASCITTTMLLVLFFFQCTYTLGKHEYINYVRDFENGLHNKELSDGYFFDVQFQPSELVLLQRESNLPAPEWNEELRKLSGVQYYNLIISNQEGLDIVDLNVSSIAEKQARDYYFSYNFQDAITLEEGETVLPCILYHFERQPTKDGGRTFVLGFPDLLSNPTDVKVVINSEHFSSLPIKIKILKSNIPLLAL